MTEPLSHMDFAKVDCLFHLRFLRIHAIKFFVHVIFLVKTLETLHSDISLLFFLVLEETHFEQFQFSTLYHFEMEFISFCTQSGSLTRSYLSYIPELACMNIQLKYLVDL